MPADVPQKHSDDLLPAALPPTVRAFVQRHRVPAAAVRSGGRVVLTVDGHYRVEVHPAAHNRIALQAELAGLPDSQGRGADDHLLTLAKAASGLLQRHASTLCIDRKRQGLALQQILPAGADVRALENALADFVNALAFWTRLCSRQPISRPGARA